jgi:chromate transporter
MMIYLQLFLAFLQIGAFSFGGGYAAVPLIQQQAIENYGWLTVSEFTDLIAIAEMTPGPIAVNSATFVGIRVGGIFGAAAATFGVILPSLVIVTLLAWLYKKYRTMSLMQGILGSLRPAVVALIFSAGLAIFIPMVFPVGLAGLALENVDFRSICLFLAALIAMRRFHVGAVPAMLGCGAVELICQVCTRFL